MVDLRKIAKQAIYWIMPPALEKAFHDTCQYVRANLSLAERSELSKNKVLYNRHAGERCFILATGPSVKKQELRILAGEICIAVSNFFVHPDYNFLKPRYHCMAPYCAGTSEEAWQDWMDELETVPSDVTLFFGLVDKQRNLHGGRFSKREIYFLNFRMASDSLFNSHLDLTKPLFGPHSVPVMALMVAMYMGFSKIYLLGCDHDWILHMYESRHFYDEHQHAISRANHNEWAGSDLESECQNYIRLWKQYKVLQHLASLKNIKIYNATEGGMLDVFPRIELKSIL